MSKTKPVHISEASYKAIKRYARINGQTLGEAVDDIVSTGIGRKAALAAYRAKKKPQ